MVLDIIKKFEYGNTAYFECYYRDLTAELENPTSPTWTINNSAGTTIASGVPTLKSNGLYYFYWTPWVEGNFIVIWTGTILGHDVALRKKFKVKRTSLKGEIDSLSSSCSSSSSFSSSSSCSSCSSSCCSSSCSSCSSSFSSSSSCSCSSSSCSSSSCSSSFSSCSSCSCSSSSCSSSFSSSSSCSCSSSSSD